MSRRTKSRLVLVLLVLFLNLPLLQSTWTQWQVERNGAEVTAVVVDNDVLGDRDDPAYWIRYRLPDSAVADGTEEELLEQNREVEQATYDAVVGSGRIVVRVLDGEPLTSRAEGQVTGRAGLIFTLAADVVLVAFVVVLWRFGRYGRPEVLRLEAVDDVRAGSGPPGVTEDDDGVVAVTGDLLEVTEHDVVIDAAERRVVVVLDGRVVLPSSRGEQAQARGRRLV